MEFIHIFCICLLTVSVSHGVPWPYPKPLVLSIPENPPTDNSNFDNLIDGECTYNSASCGEGMTEMWSDTDAVDQHITAKCCTSGSKEEFIARKGATQCVTSNCMADQSDFCSRVTRLVNGDKLEYDEVITDKCKIQGGEYNIAICCPKGSKDAVEASVGAAENHEVPYFVHIQLGSNQCGGTIYDKRHIVTAGHCLSGHRTNPQNLVVSVGSNINGLPNSDRDYYGEKVMVHEKYTKGSRYDISILRLNRDIKFGPTVKSLKMAPSGFDPMLYGDSALATGMGLADNILSNELLFKANMKLRTDDACFTRWDAAWTAFADASDMLMCAGGQWDGVYGPIAAAGDSGSPLVCRTESGEPVLCGVTSSADDTRSCVVNKTNSCKPTTYMEVQYFSKWIASQTKTKQDPSTFFKLPLHGAPVADGMYPHQVHITTPEGKPCGGTLIAADTVVTAAQCVTNAAGFPVANEDITVMSGVSDLTTKMGMTHTVKGVGVLNGFHRHGTPVDVASQGSRVQMTDNYYINDLAVVKLNEAASVSKFPSLASSRDNFKNGANELSFPRNTSRSGKLMQREFRQMEKKECQKRYNTLTYLGKNIQISGNVECGVETYSGGSQCDRELGGGLICKGRGGKDVLCGVQIFRLCEFALPNGFLDVASNAQWIQDTMDYL